MSFVFKAGRKKMKKIETRKVKRKITEEYIMEEYQRISRIRSKEKREEEMKALAVLSDHIGEYITTK
mgnify:CR=1 FL=1|jgi:hypothetical protein